MSDTANSFSFTNGKTKTIVTTETFEWDDEKNDWVPTLKTVQTSEETPGTVYYPPQVPYYPPHPYPNPYPPMITYGPNTGSPGKWTL